MSTVNKDSPAADAMNFRFRERRWIRQMRFHCKKCKFPAKLKSETNLCDAICPKCKHPLDLSEDERMFGAYELIQALGSGGFGTVFKVRESCDRSLYTLKLIRKSRVANTEKVHLLRQVHSSRRLQHPNVVASHDFGEQGEYWYLISDYVDGLPLDRWTQKVRPDPMRSLELCAQIADVLEYIHQQRFVHRDLKPGNIIVDRNGEPHIIDFGLCKSEEESDLMAIERYRAAHRAIRSRKTIADNSMLGTLGYAAPEQLKGSALSANPRSDIYALGVILYELITGKRPETGLGRLLNGSAMSAMLRRSKMPQNTAKQLRNLCLQAFSPKDTKRHVNAGVFSNECRSLLGATQRSDA